MPLLCRDRIKSSEINNPKLGERLAKTKSGFGCVQMLTNRSCSVQWCLVSVWGFTTRPGRMSIDIERESSGSGSSSNQ